MNCLERNIINDGTSIFPKCLIVDDLQENVLALTALLKEAEMEIHAANSGTDALELLLRHDYAVSLIDVRMPEMNGFELAELMRSTTKTRGIPIIFVTAGNSDERRIFRGYEAGAVDFLQKPLHREVVLGKVKVFLELYQQKVLLQQKIRTLRETELSLKEAMRSRDEFLSVCSHELKSPLASLKMHIDMIERARALHGEEQAYSAQKMKKFHQTADNSVQRIIYLVNDMLDASRVANGKLALNISELQLVPLVKDVLERLACILEMSGNKLAVKLDDTTAVRCDRFRIEQVLTNLLMNVSKYAPNSKVEIVVYHKNGQAHLKVRDEGPGIPSEDQRRIFECYHRVSDSDNLGGLGLGLYIAKEIIEMHKGTISVESAIGKGTTFEVTIPCTCSYC